MMHKCVHIFLCNFYVYTAFGMWYNVYIMNRLYTDYEKLKAAADACGEKVNEYIKKAIQQRMDREA